LSSERRVIIRTVGLKKQYVMKGVTTDALRGVDVEIYDAEFISVMGPSGSGKSTFFNMIGALDRPTTGRVFIDEVDVAQLTAEELAYVRCHKIGYIFQSYNLVQYMTALENVTTPMVFGGVGPDESRRRGMELLELVGLGDRWHHRPLEMSGGQQQRIFLARALAQDARIYLMDEPFAGVDAATERAIIDILIELRRQERTILVVHHDLQTVTQYFDWVLMLNMRVVASGPTEEVYTDENLQRTYGGKLTVLSQAAQAMAAQGQG